MILNFRAKREPCWLPPGPSVLLRVGGFPLQDPPHEPSVEVPFGLAAPEMPLLAASHS